jgi:hypothetical protein
VPSVPDARRFDAVGDLSGFAAGRCRSSRK